MRALTKSRLEEAVAGALAGLAAAIAVGATLLAGPIGLGLLPLPTLEPLALAANLSLAAVLGAIFGVVFGYQSHGYAASIGGGLVYGLLWWVVGALTVAPLIAGQGPTWSVAAGSAAFPSLVADLLYGALTGLGLHVLLALRRGDRPEPAPIASSTRSPNARVVIVGGGFGGVAAARRLERIFSREPDIEITLVSASNYLLFTPMLAEVASSALAGHHISTPVRASLPQTRFRRAEVASIDAGTRRVRLEPSSALPAESLPYDQLVLALGAVPNFRGIEGVEANAFTLKTLERADVEPDAEERRRQLAFVVAGGGFAGTETIAELFDLVRSVRHYYPGLKPEELRFVLVHSGDRILPEIGPELAAYALDKLSARGIEFRLGARIERATADAVSLSDGTELPSRTLVWTAGNQPNPVVASVGAELGRGGAIPVEPTLRVAGADGVWAIGDCAQIPDPDGDGDTYPPTAQHALREGRAVADNVAAVLRGAAPKPFRFRAIGVLVALGHRTAVAELRGRRFSGVLAWAIWRGVYLGKLPGLERKLRVLLDWTLDLFFSRDIVLGGGGGARSGGGARPDGGEAARSGRGEDARPGEDGGARSVGQPAGKQLREPAS